MKTCKIRRSALAPIMGLALAVCFVSAPAHAQAEDQAAARSLFNDGRKLLEQGKYEAACAKLDAAKKLYLSAGIVLNLADCYDKLGRTASAWTEFGEAATLAGNASRPDQVSEAKRRQSALEPKLTRLTVRVTRPVEGLEVQRDDAPLAPAAWGAAIPVDPGSHVIRAKAPGYKTWSISVPVSGAGRTTTVEVPGLVAEPKSAPKEAEESHAPVHADSSSALVLTDTPPSTRSTRSHAVDWVMIGVGAAVGIGGGALMLVEANRAQQARDQDDLDKYNSAKTPYYVGLGGVIGGSLTAAVGMLLLTTGGGGQRAMLPRAVPWVASRSGGVELVGKWW